MKCINGIKKMIGKVTGIKPDDDVNEGAGNVDTKKTPAPETKEIVMKNKVNP
jgi:hypothetical protein